jgi:hypothetical protein
MSGTQPYHSFDLMHTTARFINESIFVKLQKEIKVILTLCGKLPVYPMEYYIRQGWKIVPVIAVDFSSTIISNKKILLYID